MADDLQNYKLQLQQVEAYVEPNKSYAGKRSLDEVGESSSATAAAEKSKKARPQWKIGDKCQAKWTEDGDFYDATIEGISENGEVNLVFEAYQNRSTTTLAELKERVVRNEVFPSNKRLRPNNKEYLKKKKAKKQQRFKVLEEEREQDKNKWLNFTTKNTKKTGQIKAKSIFASPDNVNGRVGIGTCGVSGKEMTKYSYGDFVDAPLLPDDQQQPPPRRRPVIRAPALMHALLPRRQFFYIHGRRVIPSIREAVLESLVRDLKRQVRNLKRQVGDLQAKLERCTCQAPQ